MSIHVTTAIVRQVCRNCGHIHDEAIILEEPIPVEDFEVLAHETICDVGFADGVCPICLRDEN